MRRAALILVTAASLPGCAERLPACPPGAELWTRSELYFGLSAPGGPVPEEAFGAFVAGEVTPRFPDGMTVLEARGRWRAPDGEQIEEDSRVVVLFHPPSREADDRLDAIRARYAAAFEQQSVLLAQRPECVSF